MVIIGFQVLVWMMLVVFTVFGYEWIDLSKLKDWTTILSVALVGASYTLGIVFDSLMATLFAPWESRSRMFLPKEATENPGRMRAYIMAKNPDASEELLKRANRNSLLRATSINLVLISITSLIWVQKQFGFSVKLDTMIVISTGLLVGLAITTWHRSLSGYYFYLNEVYRAITASENKGTHPASD